MKPRLLRTSSAAFCSVNGWGSWCFTVCGASSVTCEDWSTRHSLPKTTVQPNCSALQCLPIQSHRPHWENVNPIFNTTKNNLLPRRTRRRISIAQPGMLTTARKVSRHTLAPAVFLFRSDGCGGRGLRGAVVVRIITCSTAASFLERAAACRVFLKQLLTSAAPLQHKGKSDVSRDIRVRVMCHAT